MSKAIFGQKYEISKAQKTELVSSPTDVAKKASLEVVEGYCTEAIITLRDEKKVKKDKIAKELENYGDSIVVVKEADILKIHVHTKKPGKVILDFQKYGEFGRIKIDNMDIQVEKEKIKQEKWKNNAIIAVANGSGYRSEYSSLGRITFVEGEQSDNPSVQDFLNAIENIGSKNIFILPNNSNIILAAHKAAEMHKGSKNIFVIPTKSPAQGLVVSYIFNPDEKDYIMLKDELMDAFENSIYGQVTQAIKNASLATLKLLKVNTFQLSVKK